MDTFTLVNGYDRKKTPEVNTYRAMTIDEAKALRPGQEVWFFANDGKARRLKVNGAVKTWKTDADRIEVPVKYGLREYDRLTAFDGWMNRLLVRVGQ